MQFVAHFAAHSTMSRTNVLQGALDLMILQIAASMGPLHGYAIAARPEQVSDGALLINLWRDGVRSRCAATNTTRTT